MGSLLSGPRDADPRPVADLRGKRVCIVLLTGLGDVVMGLPLANALARHAPGLRISWVVEPMPAGVLRHHPSIDDVVIYEKRRGAAGVRALRRELARREFDLTLNLNVYFKSIWATLFSGAPERLGFGRDRARDGVWLFSNRHLPPRPRSHTLDMFLEFAEYLGIRDPAIEFGLRISEEERSIQRDFFAPIADRPLVALVPATGNERKDWLPERFAAVVDALEHDFGYRVVLVGGPGERETRLARAIADLTSAAPVWALGDGVRRLLWLIDGCQLVVAPDTGPVHIARALDVPVIGLYGHTNPWRVGPYGKFEDLWVDAYTDPGEVPDPSRFDPKQDRMARITVQEVLERVERAARDHRRPAPEWST